MSTLPFNKTRPSSDLELIFNKYVASTWDILNKNFFSITLSSTILPKDLGSSAISTLVFTIPTVETPTIGTQAYKSKNNSEINKNLMKGFPFFLRKIIPLTVITAIMYLIVFYFISEKFGIDESIIKIIFVGLASLTFPHILLEFMVEKK